MWPEVGSGSQESSSSDLLRERTRRNQVMMAIIRATPRVAANIEPTIIGVVFLLVVEATEATVGDAVPRELVEVVPTERLRSEGTAVIGPARTVGWRLAPGGGDDAGTEFEVITGVEFEGLPSVPNRGVGEGVGVGATWEPGLEF